MPLQVLDIIEGTSVDGVGLRTSIYFAGCRHHCPSCHNPQSWDHAAGRQMEIDEILKVVDENECNVTFSGGDPMEQAERLLPLARAIRERGYTIWCYTGYTYDEILDNPRLSPLLEYIEVLVDGRFIADRRDISLRFRGSSNQRLIDVAASSRDDIRLWCP